MPSLPLVTKPPTWRATWSGLAAPRRAVPILLIAVPLVVAQNFYSPTAPVPTALSLALVLSFVLLSPHLWRLGFESHPARPLPATLFVLSGSIPALLMLGLSRYELGNTFLTSGVNVLVSSSLYWVGGWGLGRDLALEARAKQLEVQAEQAQILALQAHLDPHFLFNTLNALAEWTRDDPAVAEQGLVTLSHLLRRVFDGIRQPHWSLEQELELVEDLWKLHQLRDPERIQVQIQRGDLPSVELPPLLLLPLAENAVTHGLGHPGPAQLSLSVSRAPRQVVIELSNSGPLGKPSEASSGLDFVQRRLQLHFDGDAHLALHGDTTTTHARVTLPVHAP